MPLLGFASVKLLNEVGGESWTGPMAISLLIVTSSPGAASVTCGAGEPEWKRGVNYRWGSVCVPEACVPGQFLD